MKADQKLQTLFIRSIDAFDGLQESAFYPAVVTSLMTPAALNYANSCTRELPRQKARSLNALLILKTAMIYL